MSPGKHLTTSSNKAFFTINNFNYVYRGRWCTWAHVSAEGVRRYRVWSCSLNQTWILDKSSKHSSPEPIRTSLITIPNQNWESDQPDPTLTGTVYVHRSLAYTPVLSVKHTWEEWGWTWGSVDLLFVPFYWCSHNKQISLLTTAHLFNCI